VRRERRGGERDDRVRALPDSDPERIKSGICGEVTLHGVSYKLTRE
jgi:hypothetical protein